MKHSIRIHKRKVGPGNPVYIIAEMSGNHNQDFEQAVGIMHAAKEAGADAVKLQTYTPDTLTIDCHNSYFQIKGTLWDGHILYDLYRKAYMPWEWHPKLKTIAEEINLDLFSTAYDASAVEYLEKMDVPVHKVASFENIDIPLIERMARTGKPLLISTGMATLGEIEEAVRAARQAGTKQVGLFKCTSAYPAPPEEMNIRTIPHLSEAFHVPVGLSDHTMGITVPVAAVAMGACMIEKHFTLSREIPGPDSAFSLEPHEFKEMAEAIRTVEKALGDVHYGVNELESKSWVFRRSLFVVQDMKAGDLFTEENVRSIRPGHGLLPKYMNDVLGRRAARDITRGTPVQWKFLQGD